MKLIKLMKNIRIRGITILLTFKKSSANLAPIFQTKVQQLESISQEKLQCLEHLFIQLFAETTASPLMQANFSPLAIATVLTTLALL